MFKMPIRFRRTLFALAIVFPLAGCTALEVWFAPESDPWQRWTVSDPNSAIVVDHGAWGDFLETYMQTGKKGVNRIAYGEVSDADRQALQDYLAWLNAVPVSRLRREEQQAYWINLYNALTVSVILDHYPVATIQDIDLGPGLFSIGPWNRKLISVEGVMVSLNDIEHRILRPIWSDSRIHYAVNCASIGCPNLQRMPYSAARMDEMLDNAAEAYVNSPRGVAFVEDALVLSKIYVWFMEDFGGTEDAVLEHLKKFADDGLRAKLDRVTGIAGYEYDWSLNDTAESISLEWKSRAFHQVERD